MAYSLGVRSPFLKAAGAGAGEVAARAALYGRPVRSSADTNERALYWSYGKKSWGRIGGGGAALGFAGSPIMSNSLGDLDLYSSRRHLPKLPLLNSIECSNEGALGSLIKGSFSFTVYPEVNMSSMALGAIEGAYFRPGAMVGISFGWSSYASAACASRFGFTGTIFSFNWSVNQDMSVSAKIETVSAATISVGAPGAQNKTNAPAGAPAAGPAATTSPTPAPAPGTPGSSGPGFAPLDPKQLTILGTNLVTCIDQDMAVLDPIGSAGSAGGTGVPGTPPATGANPSELYGIAAGQVMMQAAPASGEPLVYYAVGIPWQPDPPTEDEVIPALGSSGTAGSSGTPVPSTSGGAGSSGAITTPIVKKYWFVEFGSIEDFINAQFQGATLGNVTRVDIKFNLTNGYAHLKSAFPTEIIWGPLAYGTIAIGDLGRTPYSSGGDWAGIGSICLGVDYVKETWRKFFNEEQTKYNEKNILGFLNELCKRINEASGDHWSMHATVVEDSNSCGGPGVSKAVISVEDANFKDNVGPFKFVASAGRPMIKTVSISCKPPGPIATAAFVAARGGNQETDVPVRGQKTGPGPGASITSLEAEMATAGVNQQWQDAYRAALMSLRKSFDGAWMESALYPVDFSVTVDGVSGFEFGDAVTTNLLPSSYAGKMFFTITKINHKVDASAWETTINTAARLR
jgi:hypothetical protein